MWLVTESLLARLAHTPLGAPAHASRWESESLEILLIELVTITAYVGLIAVGIRVLRRRVLLPLLALVFIVTPVLTGVYDPGWGNLYLGVITDTLVLPVLFFAEGDVPMSHGYYSLVLLFGIITWLALRSVEPRTLPMLCFRGEPHSPRLHDGTGCESR